MALMIHQHAREKLEALDKNSAGFRREVERLLEIYPDFAPALDSLATLCEQSEDFSAALRLRQSAFAVDPLNGDYSVSLARLHHEKFSEKEIALKILKRVLESQPNHQGALALLCEIQVANDGTVVSSKNTNANAPLVSAIVSAYKSTRYLRGCLEDLENQTIADRLEIIVVDSNSPEDERSIIEEFQKRHSNVVYIRSEERETVYGAWNRGIKAARGKVYHQREHG